MKIFGRIAAAVVAVSLLLLGVAAPTSAAPGEIQGKKFATWNLQGGTDGTDSKWTTGVQRLVFGYGSEVSAHNVVALQEAGSRPPGTHRNIVASSVIAGQTYEVAETLWQVDGEHRYIYFMETDPTGHRVNLAMVTDRVPDAFYIVPGSSSIERSRPSFGVRFGSNIFWTVHALSGGGNDAPAYIRNMNALAGVHYSWLAMGDFNQDPAALRERMPRGSTDFPLAHIEDSGDNTYQGASELDYAVGSIDLAAGVTAHVLPNLAGSDHWPVEFRPLPELSDEDVAVRVMPVGDSITYGVGSLDVNGYREELYGGLAYMDLDPDFIGSNSSGSMGDPQHNGHRGYKIDDITEIVKRDTGVMRPNVVTLMAGTNDVQSNADVAGAPARLGKMIDTLQAESPGVAIAVATLVPIKNDPAAQTRRDAFNVEVRALVKDRQARGQRVELAELGPMTDAMLFDRLHPNDRGYEYMAEEFFQAVMTMRAKGWIEKAGSGGDGSGCPAPGGGWGELGRIAQGPAEAAAKDVHGEVRLPDLNGDGRADYAVLTKSGEVYLWTRTTEGWSNRGRVADGTGAAADRVRFADMDGDGDDDYLVVDDEGVVTAWRNDGVADRGGAWKAMGVIADRSGNTVPQELGPGKYVQFADIDGDGDDDYLVVHPHEVLGQKGVIWGWLNDGVFQHGRSAWKFVGWIGHHKSDSEGPVDVRLADMDGDGDADYLIVSESGAVNVRRNNLGSDPEKWLYEWGESSPIAKGTGIGGSSVILADADADGDADYFTRLPDGTVDWWENDEVATRPDWEHGLIRKGLYADHLKDPAAFARTVHFADMDADGDADYVVVGSKGEAWGWRNDDVAERGTNAWIRMGLIAEGVTPSTAERIVFADYDGDGYDDYLVVNDRNGATRAWHNEGVFTKGVTAWTSRGTMAHGPAAAAHGEVRFADIDADGRDDYLVVAPDHSVQAWKNQGTNAGDGGGWATPVLLARPSTYGAGQQTMFANLNCDGRADYLLRDPAANNLLYGWFNQGEFTNNWSPKKKVAHGVAMGFPVDIHLADLSGDGADDYLVVDPENGATRAWLNKGGNQADPG
ncbi:FG-GAP-like repeat-containing protein [Streptomyces griseus]|uniref:FG-GAP-like repeat-containing protein n=1 Tax=Streptomyces griseus TaxID=1911 RepID=UPI0037F6766C